MECVGDFRVLERKLWNEWAWEWMEENSRYNVMTCVELMDGSNSQVPPIMSNACVGVHCRPPLLGGGGGSQKGHGHSCQYIPFLLSVSAQGIALSFVVSRLVYCGSWNICSLESEAGQCLRQQSMKTCISPAAKYASGECGTVSWRADEEGVRFGRLF